MESLNLLIREYSYFTLHRSDTANMSYTSMFAYTIFYYNFNFLFSQQKSLQIDLTKQVSITGIATQGFYGDEHRYVTEYLVQYSDDADLWREDALVII